MRPETPESCGNGDGVETLEIQKQDSQGSHSVLEISRKQRDSHISTAPTAPHCVSTKQPRLKELGAVEKWKSKKQDSHFPTAPMACGAGKKILKVSTMCPVRCVYHVPVLTHTHVNAGLRDRRTIGRVACARSAGAHPIPPIIVASPNYCRVADARIIYTRLLPRRTPRPIH